MSNITVSSVVKLHGVERSDSVATYAEVAALVGRARQALSDKEMPAAADSAVGSLFAQADRLYREWQQGIASDDIEMLMLADEAARIAEAVLEAIEQPDTRESIRRITASDMRLSTRQPSQGKDALWELDLLLFLRRRGVEVLFKDPPDLEITLPGVSCPYGIACKKVYSEKSLNRQFSKGLKQLRPYSGAGLVAFNLDDLTPERSLLRAPARHDASDYLHKLNVAFIERHHRRFQNAVVEGLCDGVWIWSCVHADIPDLSPRFNRIAQNTIWTVSGVGEGRSIRLGALKNIVNGSSG